jgi:hypothetical protein
VNAVKRSGRVGARSREGNGIQEEPEPDLSVAVIGVAVGKEKEVQVTADGVGIKRSPGVIYFIFVRHAAKFMLPTADVDIILGAATGENAICRRVCVIYERRCNGG